MDNKLVHIEREGQRVLLTTQLAESYGATPEIISNNFNRNKERINLESTILCLRVKQSGSF